MDLGPINEVLGLASTAVGLTGKAASTINTIKGLFDTDKTPDSLEASKLINVLAGELTAANIMNVQLSEALRKLAAEIRRIDDFEAEKARYELHETSEGALVYKIRAECLGDQPEHYICPTCLNRDRLISFLQGTKVYKRCQNDKTHSFHFAPSPATPRDNRWARR